MCTTKVCVCELELFLNASTPDAQSQCHYINLTTSSCVHNSIHTNAPIQCKNYNASNAVNKIFQRI